MDPDRCADAGRCQSDGRLRSTSEHQAQGVFRLAAGFGSRIEVSSPLRALTAWGDADKGFGTNNGMSYCNSEADALLIEGLTEVDDGKRLRLFQDAVRLVIKDGAFIPIHQQVATWAARKGIEYEPRTNEATHASSMTAPTSPPKTWPDR